MTLSLRRKPLPKLTSIAPGMAGLLLALAICAIDTHNVLTAAVAAIGVFGLTCPIHTYLLYERVSHLLNSRRMPVSVVLTVGLVLGASTATFFSFVDPANAQFFKGAETWFQTAIPGMDATLTGLVFNVLRAVFLLYVAISIVQVVQKMREGDDWQTLARTPLIIVVAISLGDALATMIIGSGSSTTTTE